MSRSYKHTPRSGQQKSGFSKTQANKRLRQRPIPDGEAETAPLNHSSYKKNYCSWDICDYEEVGVTWEEYWRGCMRFWSKYQKWHGLPPPNMEEEKKKYYKAYKRK